MNVFNWQNGHFILVSAEPVVILMKNWLFLRPGKAEWLTLQFLRHRHAQILVGLSWSHESTNKGCRADILAKRVRRYQKVYRNHRVTILVNTIKEEEVLQAKGLDTLFCNGAAFVSESIYYPIQGFQKDFDAIYDAAVSPYKRLELARDIRNLALISYLKPDSSDQYVTSVIKTLGHARWLNGRPDRELQWYSCQEVNHGINRARVGLCLSAEEGYMNASAQYLLAGLPVVSTRSLGGRDVFYDPAFVREVADDAKAVASAVEDLCTKTLPTADSIRRSTLEKLAEHRGRFMHMMRDLLAGSDCDGVWGHDWPEQFPHKSDGRDISLRANLDALKNPQLGPPWLNSANPAENR